MVEQLNRWHNHTGNRFNHLAIQPITNSLSFILALADFFEHGESGLFGVRNGQRLELMRRVEAGDDFAHRLFARRTFGQFWRAQRPPQREPSAAHLALAFTQLVLVKRHDSNFDFQLLIVEWNFLTEKS
jgi:hypothetical protein